MKTASPFSRSALVLLLACAVALFALSVLLPAYDDDPVGTRPKSGPGSYSLSALGNAGLYESLRRMGWPVLHSAGNALAMAGSRGSLVVAEPDLDSLDTRLLDAPRVLLVLPKWHGIPDAYDKDWISGVHPLPLREVRRTLALLTLRGGVLRRDWPALWQINELGVPPSPPAGADVVQLIRSRELTPLLGTRDAMLLGELRERGRVVWVLSDPDVMANHGLDEGGNALFMVTLLDRLRRLNGGDPEAPLVFDESVHGYQESEITPLKLMFRFPFVVVVGLVAATGALLLLAGAGRFGAPRLPPPAMDFGKARLIDNSARLLDYAGHHSAVLQRYIRMCVRSAGRALHAPQALDDSALTLWLDRIGEARGLTLSCAAILHEASRLEADGDKGLIRLFDCAWNIYRWKGELLNGSAQHKLSG